MMQVHILISGFVQGVGYRVFVRSNARKIGIKGWVRNLSDGRVEIVGQGQKEKLEQLIDLCKKGPFLSEVKNVAVSFEKPGEIFNDFEKRPTE